MKLCMQSGKALFVSLPGEIDHHKASALAREIDDAIIEVAPKELVFDFSSVRFMDSSGIGLLIGRYRNMKCLEGQVYMSNVTGHMAKVISLSGLEKYIGKYEDRK